MAKQHHRAVLWTLLQVMSLPVAVIFLLIMAKPPGNAGTAAIVMTTWFAACAIIDFTGSARAAHHLKYGFRYVVAERK